MSESLLYFILYLKCVVISILQGCDSVYCACGHSFSWTTALSKVHASLSQAFETQVLKVVKVNQSQIAPPPPQTGGGFLRAMSQTQTHTPQDTAAAEAAEEEVKKTKHVATVAAVVAYFSSSSSGGGLLGNNNKAGLCDFTSLLADVLSVKDDDGGGGGGDAASADQFPSLKARAAVPSKAQRKSSSTQSATLEVLNFEQEKQKQKQLVVSNGGNSTEEEDSSLSSLSMAQAITDEFTGRGDGSGGGGGGNGSEGLALRASAWISCHPNQVDMDSIRADLFDATVIRTCALCLTTKQRPHPLYSECTHHYCCCCCSPLASFLSTDGPEMSS